MGACQRSGGGTRTKAWEPGENRSSGFSGFSPFVRREGEDSRQFKKGQSRFHLVWMTYTRQASDHTSLGIFLNGKCLLLEGWPKAKRICFLPLADIYRLLTTCQALFVRSDMYYLFYRWETEAQGCGDDRGQSWGLNTHSMAPAFVSRGSLHGPSYSLPPPCSHSRAPPTLVCPPFP